MRGNTFTVGDRITMGGVRGDVIALTFTQTKIMEMGQPPAVQGADPAMWVRSRQFTGRIVTVTNDKGLRRAGLQLHTRVSVHLGGNDGAHFRIALIERGPRQSCSACVAEEAKALDRDSEPVRHALEKRYFISLDDLTPRVFYRLTDNWLELTVRFVVREHGIREVKDTIARAVIRNFDEAGIEIASATYEIVGVPPLRVVNATA